MYAILTQIANRMIIMVKCVTIMEKMFKFAELQVTLLYLNLIYE